VTLGNKSSVLAWVAAVALTAATAGVALGQANPQSGQPPPAPAAQQAPAPPQAPNAAPASAVALPPQPPAVEKRGFLNDFGNWWKDSIASFNAKIKEQQAKLDESNKKSSDAMKDAAAATQQAMKNAADAMVRLGTSKIVEVHEVCAIAGNGAPDCQSAATNACHAKGFSTGQPLDIRTAEKCTASLWVSGQNPVNGDCPVESVVLRAACQ
jgi:hypothetical protein